MSTLKWLLIILFLFIPLVVSAEKAKTIDELSNLYDVSQCGNCHSKIYEEWSNSIHARSLIGTGPTMKAMKAYLSDSLPNVFTKAGVKGIDDIKVEHLKPCFKCHLPQIDYATDDVAKEIAKAIVNEDSATLKKLNINCLICHNLKAIVHKWQDGEPEKGVVYGSKDGTHSHTVYSAMKKSPIMKNAVMCGQCHGLGPNLEFPQPSQCATLYGSYLHSYIPSGGTETCQDCHMKKANKGHSMPAYRDPEMVKMAVDVGVEARGYKFLPKPGEVVPMAVVTVKITNKAGHRIPDG